MGEEEKQKQEVHDSIAEYFDQLQMKNSDFEIEEEGISIMYDEDEEVKMINSQNANSSALFKNSQLDESDRWFFND